MAIAEEWERYLHEHIPLAGSMGVGVASVEDEHVLLRAPLEPNINHRETAFGGSLSAIAILAGWSLIQARLAKEGLAARLVIQRNTMSYDAPVDKDFLAQASFENPADWERFARTLRRRGAGRITAVAEILVDGRVCGRLVGEFVALRPPATTA